MAINPQISYNTLSLAALLLQLITATALGGFDIYHRYSDEVTHVIGHQGLLKEYTAEHYTAWAARDQQRLSGGQHSPALTFAGSNGDTYIHQLGYLHYANISLGTPARSFFIPLDTGSDLFWLPCKSTTKPGEKVKSNIYSPSSSSTSSRISCKSPACRPKRKCPLLGLVQSPCTYEVEYLKNHSTTKGILVEDVLHLETYDRERNTIQAPVIIGCGLVQTGDLLRSDAPKGLMGLGFTSLDVPSLLAQDRLVGNAFSLCFAFNGNGRIAFGDKGTTDHKEAPFFLDRTHAGYNILLTQLAVERNVTNVDSVAVFDSGSTFTHLSDPAYTFISENFNSLMKEPRVTSIPQIPFEYCYYMGLNQTSFWTPTINITMKGGDNFKVLSPTMFYIQMVHRRIYCLGILKSNKINIIGNNFMVGYHLVFDREKFALRWKASDCKAKEANTTTSPTSKATSPTMASKVMVFLVLVFSFAG